MNFATRVLASEVEVDALTYDQFRKWDYEKQVDYLNRHPESDFRLPEDSEKKKEDTGEAPTSGQPGEQAPEPGADQPSPGPEEKEDKPGPATPKGDAGSIGTPRSGGSDGAPMDITDDVPDPLEELLQRGITVTNKTTGERAVRMDYDQSRDLIDDYLNRGWALKYDLATGSQLQKGNRQVTLKTEPSGKSLVRVSQADADAE